jgi:hypothetical protein
MQRSGAPPRSMFTRLKLPRRAKVVGDCWRATVVRRGGCRCRARERTGVTSPSRPTEQCAAGRPARQRLPLSLGSNAPGQRACSSSRAGVHTGWPGTPGSTRRRKRPATRCRAIAALGMQGGRRGSLRSPSRTGARPGSEKTRVQLSSEHRARSRTRHRCASSGDAYARGMRRARRAASCRPARRRNR